MAINRNPPDGTNPPYQQQQIPGLESPDLVAQSRAADVSNTIESQTESVNALLKTMNTRLTQIHSTVSQIPAGFEPFAKHLGDTITHMDKLAASSKKVADQGERGAKAAQNQTFSIKDAINALKTGNFAGAAAELFQQGKGSANLQLRGMGLDPNEPAARELGQQFTSGAITKDQFKSKGAELAAAEVAAGRGLLGSGAQRLAARAGGFITADVGLSLLAAQQLFQGIQQNQKEDLRLGQLTGEGRLAGLSAGGINLSTNLPFIDRVGIGHVGGEIGDLRGSPFDLIGDKEATQIVQGVRGAGLRGAAARSLEDTIRNMVNDLGIGVEDAMAIAVPAIKQAGMSTGELAVTMSDLDDMAKRTNIGIGEITKSFGKLLADTAQQSQKAAGQAKFLFATVAAEFPAVASMQGGTAALAGVSVGKGREAIGLLTGVSPLDVYDLSAKEINKRFYEILSTVANRKPPEQSWQHYVRELLFMPLYQDLFSSFNGNVPMIIKVLQKAGRTSGNIPGAIGSAERTAHTTLADEAAKHKRAAEITRKQHKPGTMFERDFIDPRPIERGFHAATGFVGGLFGHHHHKTPEEQRQEYLKSLKPTGFQKEIAASPMGAALNQRVDIYTHNEVSLNPKDRQRLTVNSKRDQRNRGEIGSQGVQVH